MIRVNATPDTADAPRRSNDRRRGFHLVVLATVLAAIGLQACSGRVYDPARATRRYPTELDQERMLEIQVIRDGGELIVVNATPQSFCLQLHEMHLSECEFIVPSINGCATGAFERLRTAA